MLRALELNLTEQLLISAFVASNRDWIARHALPLEIILRRALLQQRLHLLHVRKVEAHPVYVLSLRLAQRPLATKSDIERAVGRAFAAAGRSVKPEFTRALIRGNRARVDVYVDD